jgi:hypothetical protein
MAGRTGKIMSKPLWVWITLYDVGGQVLASWPYDEIHPVIPPRFTYPNENHACPYVIEFRWIQIWKVTLPIMDLNLAIDYATRLCVAKIRAIAGKG